MISAVLFDADANGADDYHVDDGDDDVLQKCFNLVDDDDDDGCSALSSVGRC